ncbi:MAG: hypothetical protein COA67_08330 [Lutibacter sp.]|nr:MAG: hypothetical protein COA67_08330 [Lutibacter sp.]
MKKIIAFFLLTFAFFPNTYAQCAMCKAVVESGDAELAQGLNNGIVYLMAFPYLLIGGLFYFIYRYKTKKKN